MQHAMTCFARLVRALLGEGAIAARRLECGATLVVLGISVTLADDGFSPAPAKEKASMCIDAISEARPSGVLRHACAAKIGWQTELGNSVYVLSCRSCYDPTNFRPAICEGRSNKRCSGCSVEVVAVCVGPRRL